MSGTRGAHCFILLKWNFMNFAFHENSYKVLVGFIKQLSAFHSAQDLQKSDPCKLSIRRN